MGTILTLYKQLLTWPQEIPCSFNVIIGNLWLQDLTIHGVKFFISKNTWRDFFIKPKSVRPSINILWRSLIIHFGCYIVFCAYRSSAKLQSSQIEFSLPQKTLILNCLNCVWYLHNACLVGRLAYVEQRMSRWLRVCQYWPISWPLSPDWVWKWAWYGLLNTFMVQHADICLLGGNAKYIGGLCR